MNSYLFTIISGNGNYFPCSILFAGQREKYKLKQKGTDTDMDEKQINTAAVEEAEESAGNIKISSDVIATVAGIATNEIKGVAGMGGSVVGGIAEILGGKKNKGRGVKVEMSENNVVIDIYIIVEYGASTPDIAWEIQDNVKNSVESMTGMNVENVNIHVEGVSFEKAEASKPEEVLTEEETAVEEQPASEEN